MVLALYKGGEVVGDALRKVLDKDEHIGYISSVHGDSKGWITKAEKNNGYRQWHYHYPELLEQDFKADNVYMSMNTFYSTYRRIEYIKELKSQFIDLDIYKTNYSKAEIINILEKKHFEKTIPRPNMIIDSGRGMYLIWKIKSVPSQALPLWKAVEEYLYNVLKEFGADRQALDPTRILRVPGSINSKSRTKVKILEQYEYIYELREIQNKYLPELEEKVKKKGRPKKTVFIHRERSLYYARIKDIIKLCELREYNLTGQRELILFLYRYYSCMFTEDPRKALEDVLELNSQFTQPLRESEVKRATMSAERVFLSKDKEYKYKNETLIELLNISAIEQLEMTTIISKDEYKRRENIRGIKNYKKKLEVQGKLSEKDKISQRRVKIKDLLDKGLKQKDICSTLNISKRACIRDISYLKEQGLI